MVFTVATVAGNVTFNVAIKLHLFDQYIYSSNTIIVATTTGSKMNTFTMVTDITS